MAHRLAALLLIAAGCGGSGPFALTAADNDPKALTSVFARLENAPQGPINKLGKPVAAVVTKTELALVDLDAGQVIWKVVATVESKVAIGREIVVARESGKLVGRDVGTGAVRFQSGIAGDLVGLDADASGVYVVTQKGRGWTLRAIDNSGGDRWSADSGGALGAPSAARGIVLVPFLNQWLAILDAKSGNSLTRVRAVDEEIEFVHRTASEVFFGSESGVTLLDVKAASGSRAQSTHASAKLPPALAKLSYARDAYDAKQGAYTALDQRRLVWSAAAAGDALAFGNGTIAAHYYRFLFGLEAKTGALRWAYSHPKIDLIAAADVGGTIVAIATDGTLVALDAATGAVLARRTIDGLTGLKGATIEASGFRPAGAGEPPNSTEVLTAIVFDRDSRFERIKKLAIEALATDSSPEATRALINVARDAKGALGESAANALVKRADPGGAEALTSELEKPDTTCIALCARALAAIDPGAISEAIKARAQKTLLSRFESPATIDSDFAAVAQALARHGKAGAIAAMRRFFLVHRADPTVGENIAAIAAITDALAKAGGSARSAAVFAADDPVTDPAIAADARRALAK